MKTEFGFERKISWNKYESKKRCQTQKDIQIF